MIEESSPTEEQTKNAKLFDILAMIVGYNFLCQKAPTLGEKVYCRLVIDRYEKEYIELGEKSPFDRSGDKEILVIDDRRPWIKFRDIDIEKMRECVAKWDEEHPK